MDALQKELSKTNKGSARLSAAVEDVDKVIEMLSAARDQVAASWSPYPNLRTLIVLVLTVICSAGSPYGELDDGKTAEPDQGGFRNSEPGPERCVQVSQELGQSVR
jgi:hypothetical protein